MPDTITQTQSSPESIFMFAYEQSTKSAVLSAATSGYFLAGDAESAFTDEQSSGENKFASGATVGAFWEMIITSIAEVHAEQYAMHNSLADSVSIFSTGSKPIQISIVGKLLHSKTDDHYFQWLKNYSEKFRARHLTASQRSLLFVSQDTTMNIIITSFTLSFSPESETYVDISISGLAYGHKMEKSTEDFILPGDVEYYGKVGGIQDSSTEILKDVSVVKANASQDASAANGGSGGVSYAPDATGMVMMSNGGLGAEGLYTPLGTKPTPEQADAMEQLWQAHGMK